MFNAIFGSTNKQKKIVHCEISGQESSLNQTTILTKINGLIALKHFDSPSLDENKKVIYSSTQPPLKYYSEIDVPTDLKSSVGRLFSIVDDEDELEQSTAVMSPEGKRIFTGNQIIPLFKYINEYAMLEIPATMFLAIIDNEATFKIGLCENWNVQFNSVGRKYRFKKILEEKREKQIFGRPGILWPGFDVAIGDCCQNNPQGTGYLFKTNKEFQHITLACNESAVDYCIKNNCLVYYNDFMNKGALRILSAYTEDVNRKLQNKYLFRSSNM